jgi:glycosyltransferase involved in cell wall biosynthesis
MISIIIPTKNNIDILLESLRKIVELNVNSVELIVVNDGNDFEIPSDVKEKIIFLKNKENGVSVARNYGASVAQGEVLFFTDDDMWVNIEALDEINRISTNNLLEKDVYILNWMYPKDLIENLQQHQLGRYIIKVRYHSASGRMMIAEETKDIIRIKGIGSGSMVISKKLFLEIGGYNENINFQGEDIEFSNKLKRKGYSIYFDSNVCLEHNQIHRADIKSYLERINIGYKSEFVAIRNGLIQNNYTNYSKFKYYFYSTLIPFEKWIFMFYKVIPNNSFFDKISFKIINVLSGTQLVKNMRYFKN